MAARKRLRGNRDKSAINRLNMAKERTPLFGTIKLMQKGNQVGDLSISFARFVIAGYHERMRCYNFGNRLIKKRF